MSQSAGCRHSPKRLVHPYLLRIRGDRHCQGPASGHSLNQMAPIEGSAQDLFKSMLRLEIAPMLRTQGWKGSGKDFKRSSDLYRAYINFQKSQHNTRDEVSFTVNLGVLNEEANAEQQAARRDLREKWGSDAVLLPTWGSWSRRLGHLLPIGRDKWWRLLSGKSPEQTMADVRDALINVALPTIQSQMNKPRVEPSFIIESKGSRCGQHDLPSGDRRWYNVGGRRLFPLDSLLDAVDREFELVEPMRKMPTRIPIDFHRIPPDGWVSVDVSITRRLAEDGVQLSEGTVVFLIQWWMDSQGQQFNFQLAGEAHLDPQTGWRIEVSPRSVQDYLEAAKKYDYMPVPLWLLDDPENHLEGDEG